ncbi:hypothetical protein HY623_00015 [Candidatus Uhrbacteria bacterium]|nr:hypothetical protein [Candidatus Uhrbacteria bacterium]
MSYFMVRFLLVALLAGGALYASAASAAPLSNRLSGRILLQVEDKGKAWYVEPTTKERAYLGKPADAFRVMRELGLGITNADLDRIAASDNEKSGDTKFARKLAGKIVLQVQAHGEAWYINPTNLKRYYLGRPADAFSVMRGLGLGISNADITTISVKSAYHDPEQSPDIEKEAKATETEKPQESVVSEDKEKEAKATETEKPQESAVSEEKENEQKKEETAESETDKYNKAMQERIKSEAIFRSLNLGSGIW